MYRLFSMYRTDLLARLCIIVLHLLITSKIVPGTQWGQRAACVQGALLGCVGYTMTVSQSHMAQ